MGTGNRCAPWLLADKAVRELRFSGSPRLASKGRGLEVAVIGCFAISCALGLPLDAGALMAKKKPPLPRAISGRVLDQNDNGISGAAVELTDLQTGKKVDIFSEADGRYQFSDLAPTHDYQVHATYKGVSSETRKASSLEERQLILNLHIPPP